MDSGQIFASRYQLIKLLGCGGFSDVWLAEDTKTHIKIAIKMYAPDKGLDTNGIEVFTKEFAIVFQYNHGNLLRPTYYDVEDNVPYLILPYCERGSAHQLVGNISEKELWKFIHDVSSGLAYLHKLNPIVIHQDIKPDNILISTTGDFVITDFGISTQIRSTLRKSVKERNGSGTTAYMGPERFSAEPAPIMASDVWSLGATLFELATGDVPFGDMGGLIQKNGADMPTIHGNYSEELKQTIEKCLAKEPWNRPTAEQLSKYAQKILDGETPTPWQNEKQEQTTSNKNSGRTTERIDKQEQIVLEEPKNIVPSKKNKKPIWLWVSLLMVAIIVGGWLINNQIERKNERIAQEQKIEQERIAKEQERQRKAEQERIAQEQERQRKAEQERQRKAEQERQRKAEQERIAELQTITVNGVTFEMVYVKGGTFTMGCTDEQGSDCEDDESPAHRVTLSDYKIGKYEVTIGLFSKFIDATNYLTDAEKEGWSWIWTGRSGKWQWEKENSLNWTCDEHGKVRNSSDYNQPVLHISWNDAEAFCKWLSQATGQRFRLPTEAEWEFAARGGNKSRGYKFSGSNTLSNVGWYWNSGSDSNADGMTHPVGQKTPNELGIYDMSGNVWEWCQDWYGSYSRGSQTNPTGPSSGSFRVLRGGSWRSAARYCRVSHRGDGAAGYRYDNGGFRVVLLP